MRDLMRQIEALAAREQARRVVMVRVRLGALCHMSGEHFREHFEEAAKGTVAEGAALEIKVSDDIRDPHAQDVLLRSIDVES